MRIKLSQWAKDNGVHYNTALRYWHQGLLHGEQLPTGTILIDSEEDTTSSTTKSEPLRVAIYARVSSSENKKNALTQAARVRAWSEANGYTVTKEVIEVGSGLNDRRKKLNDLLTKRDYDAIVVEHKDRLTRFGYEYIHLLLESHGKKIFIVNEVADDEKDLMQDFVSLVTSFCARLYGQRRSKRATERLITELQGGDDHGKEQSSKGARD